MNQKYIFVGRANGNKQHVIIAIYRTWHDAFNKQMQYWCGIEGQGRIKPIAIIEFDPLKQSEPVPFDILNEACRLQGVDFVGWCC